jgi:hypothetical protein
MLLRSYELSSHVAGEHRFFGYLAGLLAALVFAGFARTFYLHNLFSMPLPSVLLLVHGSLMSGWILLLATQTALISARRVKWHRRLGIFGAILAALSIPLGCLATIGAAQREVRAHSALMHGQLNVLGLELTQLLLFGTLISVALWYRNRPAIHKRLMVVATLCIVPNAIVRLSLLTNIPILQTNIGILSVWSFLVVGVVAIDSLRQRRISPAFAWSASVAVLALNAAWDVSRTAGWDMYWIRVLA